MSIFINYVIDMKSSYLRNQFELHPGNFHKFEKPIIENYLPILFCVEFFIHLLTYLLSIIFFLPWIWLGFTYYVIPCVLYNYIGTYLLPFLHNLIFHSFPTELTTQFNFRKPLRILNQLDGTTYKVHEYDTYI